MFPKKPKVLCCLKPICKSKIKKPLKVLESEGEFFLYKFFLLLLQTSNWKEKSVRRRLFLACLVLTKAQTGVSLRPVKDT